MQTSTIHKMPEQVDEHFQSELLESMSHNLNHMKQLEECM